MKSDHEAIKKELVPSLKPNFAPHELFQQMLRYMVIPTFDLVIEYGTQGVIIVKRKIPPYKRVWGLPGLRMLKSESIDDTIRRIARNELGLRVNPGIKVFLGQYVGRFRTEHNRQDLSTGYYLTVSEEQPIRLNGEHFSAMRIVTRIPRRTGGIYRFYLQKYFALMRRK